MLDGLTFCMVVGPAALGGVAHWDALGYIIRSVMYGSIVCRQSTDVNILKNTDIFSDNFWQYIVF